MAREGGAAQEQAEAVVVLDAGTALGAALGKVRQHAVVLQLLPPRIALVRLRGALPPPHAVPATSWFTGAVPETAGLTATERLFVDAWLARQGTKARPGEGLPWDAPGYEPPDWAEPPPGR